MKNEKDIQQDANQIIAAKLQEIYRIRNECEQLARETGVSFHFDAAYGMGGWFDPTDDNDDRSDNGWCASSRSC